MTGIGDVPLGVSAGAGAVGIMAGTSVGGTRVGDMPGDGRITTVVGAGVIIGIIIRIMAIGVPRGRITAAPLTQLVPPRRHGPTVVAARELRQSQLILMASGRLNIIVMPSERKEDPTLVH